MNPANYAYLTDLLKQKSGLVLSGDKMYLIETRLLPIARKAGLQSLDDLIVKMKVPGQTALEKSVVEAMTTNETFFFRDKTPFDHFGDTMLPALMAERSNKRIRIWCAAASSGQEPYSLAMMIKELGPKAAGWTFDIIATDLSDEVLERARSGLYSQFEVQRGLPIQLLLKYFEQKGDTWEINPEIRRMVQFRPINLLRDFSALGRFDIIFCRNVLIYFDRDTKADILSRTANVLNPGGYLVLGAAETVVGLTTDYVPVQGRRGLYATARDAAGARPPVAGAAPRLAAV